jgi:hypothetical protein
MKRRAFVLLLGLAVVRCHGQTLFPERIGLEKQAERFFRQVNLTFPGLATAAFHVQEKNYLTAFLELAAAVSADPFFTALAAELEKKELALVERFAEIRRSQTALYWPAVVQLLGSDALRCRLLYWHALVMDFKRNQLQGNQARQLWCACLDDIERLAKKSGRSAEENALLLVAGHASFFKKAPAWRKKAEKFFRKRIPVLGENPWIEYLWNLHK